MCARYKWLGRDSLSLVMTESFVLLGKRVRKLTKAVNGVEREMSGRKKMIMESEKVHPYSVWHSKETIH